MAAASYLARVGARVKEVLFVIASAGSGDAGKGVGLDSTGRLHSSVMPVGIVPDVSMLEAGEATIPARKLVNIYNDAGTPKVRLADASNNRKADGFTLDEYAIGQTVTVYHGDSIPGLSGLTPGAEYFLSLTPGEFTTAPVASATGRIHQSIGKAATADRLVIELEEPIELVTHT